MRLSLAEIADPGGRRVVLVVSDLLGQAWTDGRMGRALETWAKAGPAAVIQPLPQRLWDDCGIPIPAVALRAPSPAAPNRDLKVQRTDDSPDDDPRSLGVPVPVIELGKRWLASWTRMVIAEGEDEYHGRAIFTRETPDDHLSVSPPPTTDPQTAVLRFTRAASVDAARLAPLLAAAAPLTLPVMRLVQQAKLPSAAPTALRELFLGGLLEQVTDSTAAPEDTVYDFVQGTRKELLDNLSRQDALSVLVEVSRYLVSKLGSNLDFLALITASHPLTDLDQRARAFASVAVDVLESLGGSYRQTAARLRSLLETSGGEDDSALPDEAVSPISRGKAPLSNYSIP